MVQKKKTTNKQNPHLALTVVPPRSLFTRKEVKGKLGVQDIQVDDYRNGDNKNHTFKGLLSCEDVRLCEYESHTMFGGEEESLATLGRLVRFWSGSHRLDGSDLHLCQFPQTLIPVSDHGLHGV